MYKTFLEERKYAEMYRIIYIWKPKNFEKKKQQQSTFIEKAFQVRNEMGFI